MIEGAKTVLIQLQQSNQLIIIAIVISLLGFPHPIQMILEVFFGNNNAFASRGSSHRFSGGDVPLFLSFQIRIDLK